jgi:hypothetical protein
MQSYVIPAYSDVRGHQFRLHPDTHSDNTRSGIPILPGHSDLNSLTLESERSDAKGLYYFSSEVVNFEYNFLSESPLSSMRYAL